MKDVGRLERWQTKCVLHEDIRMRKVVSGSFRHDSLSMLRGQIQVIYLYIYHLKQT